MLGKEMCQSSFSCADISFYGNEVIVHVLNRQSNKDWRVKVNQMRLMRKNLSKCCGKNQEYFFTSSLSGHSFKSCLIVFFNIG
jgi:hypothetical protein